MSKKVLLPRVTNLRVAGARPVFKVDIDQEFRSGLNIILGGNGLGKTTAIQAAVFALSGGASQEFETEKSFRWGHSWFRGRISEESVRSAFVEIEVQFGTRTISLRRNFANSRLAGFRSEDEDWNTETPDAAFEECLREAGYNDVAGFDFLVRRLIYLGENRRLLAWDPVAQARILMLLSPYATNEREYENLNNRLVLADSRRRHAHVLVGKLERAVNNEKSSPSKRKAALAVDRPFVQLEKLSNRLEVMQQQRRTLEAELNEHTVSLTACSTEVEQLREQIDSFEAIIIDSVITTEEQRHNLSLHSLLEHGTCPACGTHQSALQEVARQHAMSHACVICGSAGLDSTAHEILPLQSRLAERLRQQELLSETRESIARSVDRIRDEETSLLSEAVNARERSYSEPSGGGAVTSLPSARDLNAAKRDEKELLLEVEQTRAQLAKIYGGFRRKTSDVFESLRDAYTNYASAFLGNECTLEAADSPDRLFMPQALVPKFNGIVRTTPESCSEAQQFFLDIALRMAMLDVAQRESKSPGSFLCETPENALDFTYIENVARMFVSFSDLGSTTVITANIQREGLASYFINKWTGRERRDRILQLLDIGNLSQVQMNQEITLRRLAGL